MPQTNEFAYSADIAGLYYDLNNTRHGVELSISGYNHKLPELLTKVAETIVQLDYDAAIFARLKDRLTKQLANYHYRQPYQHAMTNSMLILEEPRWCVTRFFVHTPFQWMR